MASDSKEIIEDIKKNLNNALSNLSSLFKKQNKEELAEEINSIKKELIDSCEKIKQILLEYEQRETEIVKELNKVNLKLNAIEANVDEIKLKIDYLINILKIEK